MSFRLSLAVLLALCAPAFALAPGGAAQSSGAADSAGQVRGSVERGLGFLEADAVRWRKDRGCATCHHGVLTVWALSAARARGFPVNETALAEFMAWARDGKVPRLEQQRDPRPGWRLVSQPAVYLAMAAHDLPILSRDEVRRVAVHLARHQEPDGAYEIPPPANAPPPVFFESREVTSLFALLAWEPLVGTDPGETAENRARREKTVAWLQSHPSTETTQALALRLLLDVRSGVTGDALEAAVSRLLRRQRADGGWGQDRGLASDAYATGQALYALSYSGSGNERPEIRRAISFLVSTQRADGSWGVTPRNYPGVDWKRTGLAMNYFGSAWAELGLLRYVSPPPDTPARRQAAFDLIRSYGGAYEVDENSPDRPVVRVDLRSYELEDQRVFDLVNALQTFPRLTALQLKSTRLTDAGLAHLKGLPQLRSLTIEGAPITDKGLAHLHALTRLEQLSLTKTGVTDAGVQALRRTLPAVKVQH